MPCTGKSLELRTSDASRACRRSVSCRKPKACTSPESGFCARCAGVRQPAHHAALVHAAIFPRHPLRAVRKRLQQRIPTKHRQKFIPVLPPEQPLLLPLQELHTAHAAQMLRKRPPFRPERLHTVARQIKPQIAEQIRTQRLPQPLPTGYPSARKHAPGKRFRNAYHLERPPIPVGQHPIVYRKPPVPTAHLVPQNERSAARRTSAQHVARKLPEPGNGIRMHPLALNQAFREIIHPHGRRVHSTPTVEQHKSTRRHVQFPERPRSAIKRQLQKLALLQKRILTLART